MANIQELSNQYILLRNAVSKLGYEIGALKNEPESNYRVSQINKLCSLVQRKIYKIKQSL